MLLEKYKPKNVKEFINNSDLLRLEEKIINYKKPILLTGSIGSGKTLALELIAKKLDLELVRSNSDEKRDSKNIGFLTQSMNQSSLGHKGKIFLIEEIEFIESISSLDISTGFPIVMTCEDPYTKKLYNLRQKCEIIKFRKIRSDSIAKFLKEICKNEDIEYEDSAINHIARKSNGDVRAAINDLVCLEKITIKNISKLGERTSENEIFETIKLIFKTKSIDNLKTIREGNNLDPRDMFNWISWNISKEYSSKDLEKGMYYLSKSDTFNKRISKRNSWSLLKYFLDFMIIGTALSKKERNNSFIMYDYPRIYPKKQKILDEDISKKLHVSKKSKAFDGLI